MTPVGQSMPLPVWGVRPDGTVCACNAFWTDYSGMTAEQTGVLLRAGCVHLFEVERALALWVEGVRAGKPFEIQCRLRRATDGTFRWHELRIAPDRADERSEGLWIVAGIDINAQKRAEEERGRLLEREQRAREEAEAANRTKDEFLATISHELRTPLNAILGWVRMARLGMLDEDRLAHALATIERSAQAQAKLVNDILDVSRIITGKLRLQVTPIDMPTIVSEAVETIRPAAEAKQIELRWDPPPWDIAMHGDPSRLQQVVWNLASNAVKFTPRGGRIDVRLERYGDSARVVVRDSGQGISPELLPFVFDRFRQGNGTPSRAHDGLGLGLSIVKHLVELHGGRVGVESAGAGQGSEFAVVLPLGGQLRAVGLDVAAFQLRGGTRRARARLPRLPGVTVLFVDDQPEARTLAETLFGHCGARVIAVDTAEQALNVLRTSPCDVLVSDIGLPDEDGYSLIRRVRALGPHAGGDIPAIALTAYARPEDERRARFEGFHVHLAKPVDPSELASLVASLLAHQLRQSRRLKIVPRSKHDAPDNSDRS